MGDPVAGRRMSIERAELEPLNPEDGFRALIGNPIHHEDTSEVLVRDGLSYNPVTYTTYPSSEVREELFILNRSRYHKRSKFIREKLEEAESNASDPNTPTRIVFENHDPEHFAAYQQYVEIGRPELAADHDNPLFPWLRLYVLADQLRDFTIANLIMNDIIRASEKFDRVPNQLEIWFVWAMIEECNHPLKKLCVDYQIYEALAGGLVVEDSNDAFFQYLNDVVFEYSELTKRKGKRGRAGQNDDIFGEKCSSRPFCYYHQHDMDRNHLSCEELGLLGETGVGQ